MIKHINHQNVSTTPFVAAKSRALYNIQNDDSLIAEINVYADGTQISLDYIDYNFGNPIISRECNIALEQQEFDSISYEEGVTGSGTFNSASDPRNTDGTYQTLVHRTTKNAFYNAYRNPTKIFGVEHIDFPLSKTLRNLSDHFRMFTIPRLIFGEKIQPKSVKLYDTLFDDNVEIFDDGYQNLIAGYNLFSKVQEVRIFPSGAGYQNAIFSGSVSNDCITFDSLFFITQPQDIWVDLGATAFFSVTAGGNPPIYYQWQTGSTNMVDGTRVTGSNTSYITINSASFADSGSYRVLVWNASNGITSSYANLHINRYPPVITNPVDTTSDIGGNFNFDISVISGWFPMNYQWESGSTLLVDDARTTGSLTGSLLLNNVSIADDSASFRIMVSNLFGGVTSSYAYGYINQYAPLIIHGPEDTAAELGGFFTFNVTASGGSPITYIWQSGSTYLIDDARISGSNVVAASTSSVYINNIVLSDSGSYRVLVSNVFGGVTSSYADGRVILHAPLVSNPMDQVTLVSGTASFHITASGTPTLNYQWISGSTNVVDGPRITGSNTPDLQINDVQFSDVGTYKMFVSNFVGSVYSNPATLTVLVNDIIVFAHDSASMTAGTVFGSVDESPMVEFVPNITTGLVGSTGIIDIIIGIYGSNETASFDTGFYSASFTQVVFPIYGSNETASFDTGFYSASITQVVFPTYGGNETASFDTGFYSASVTTIVIPTTHANAAVITTGLISGSCAP